MNEFELKLEVPADQVDAVGAELAQCQTQEVQLRALYFDVPGGLLYGDGVTIRLRREGRQWIQTAKARTGTLLERLEHNVPIDGASSKTPPPVDVARHKGSPVGDAIKRILKRKGVSHTALDLQVLFETDVRRRMALVEVQGSRIEVAFDEGRVVAGTNSHPVCELEFELKAGEPADAVALARAWCLRHRLWLSVAGKSERGRRLAAGLVYGEPATAPPVGAVRHAGELGRAALASCLDHILGNAGEVAAGSNDAEHIHQLRVGIRRLRTAMRDLPNGRQVPGEWEEPMVEVFRGLGRHRDQRLLAQGLEPVIEKAGGPRVSIERAAGDVPDPGALVRSPQFQGALLSLLGLLHGVSPGESAKKARKKLKGRLDKLHKQALEDGKRFVHLDEERQHRVRKRLKRLRYLAEFAAPVFKAGKTRAFQKELKPVQDALGVYTDELMALKTYRRIARKEPKAWFGAGWLSGRTAANAQACRAVISKFSKSQPFWK